MSCNSHRATIHQVSMASVVLTEKYSATTDLVAAQVVLGVLLLVPTTLIWCAIMDV